MSSNTNTTSFNDFFDRLASFDTETTGINTQTDRIWQAGFTRKGIDTEEVVNPFFVLNNQTKKYEPEHLSIVDFHERMVEGNGEFSREAHTRNNYGSLFYKHHVENALSDSLSDTLDKTLGNLQMGDVLVLQNHNFENKLIQKGWEDGLIESTTYERLKDKMEFIKVDEIGAPKGLLQTPVAAAAFSAEASFIYNTQMYDPRLNQRKVINKYADTMNSVMDSYKKAIERKKGAVVVEQMDVTKALYANAIKHGYMDVNHGTIGLNIDFLKKNLIGGVENHTALSDSKDTIDVFKKTWGMLEELRTDTVSEGTKRLLIKLNESQYSEVNNQFLKSIDSVINDFNTKGYSYYSRRGSFYSPETFIHDASDGSTYQFEEVSVKGRATSGKITALDAALSNIESRYSIHGNTEWRSEYIDKLKSSYRENGLSAATLLAADMKSEFKIEDLPLSKGVSTRASWWNEKTTLVGKEVTKGTKASVIAGGLLMLGYMTMKDSPVKKDENSYVAQQFYDEQYLGTQFVNFNERNKHYMY